MALSMFPVILVDQARGCMLVRFCVSALLNGVQSLMAIGAAASINAASPWF